MKKRVLGVLVLFGFSSLSAMAHPPEEHYYLTDLAVIEFNQCFSGWIGRDSKESIKDATKNEDYNLIKKWTDYSHFYNPGKKLRMRRYESDVRVGELAEEVKRKYKANGLTPGLYSSLGYMIHHIQDATSPAHVIPIMHSFFDGFENVKFKVVDYPDPQLFGNACDKWAKGVRIRTPKEILKITAKQTLKYINEYIPSITRDGKPVRMTWKAFWKESSGREFGQYGFNGQNVFGTENFVVGGHSYHVPMSVYRAFKKRQFRLAMDASRALLLWFLKL